jgi:hypothetical protein
MPNIHRQGPVHKVGILEHLCYNQLHSLSAVNADGDYLKKRQAAEAQYSESAKSASIAEEEEMEVQGRYDPHFHGEETQVVRGCVR